MSVQVTYHPGWRRPACQPQPPTVVNAGPTLALLLAVAMLAMLVVLSAGGSLAVASMAALPVVMVALSMAFAILFMEVLAWLRTENFSQFVLQ